MDNYSGELSIQEHTESVAEVELNIFNSITSNLKSDLDTAESSDDEGPSVCRKRVQRFSDSDSESQKKDVLDDGLPIQTVPTDNEDSNDTGRFKSLLQKSRIRLASDTDSDSNNESDCTVPLKNEGQQARFKNKRNNIRQKFKSLVTSRIKESESVNANDHGIESDAVDKPPEVQSDMSEDEASSIDRIRQKIKERTMHLKSTIYDPDTSEEDSSPPKETQKQKKPRKSTKLTSPKPVRMSAKQAMENMQKIKSESNRMLREKDVSLPYHRPKALSLKDIMNRRRPAVSSDGKALPIKMNEDQLKQYALSLEERQKEIMELCKSDTEEEEEDTSVIPNEAKKTEIISTNIHSIYDDLLKSSAVETKVGDCAEGISNQTKISEENASGNPNLTEKCTIDDVSIDNVSNREDTAGNNNTYKTSLKQNISITEDLLSNTNVIGNTLAEDPATNTLEANTSSEMELVYNDSVEDTNNNATDAHDRDTEFETDNVLINSEQQNSKVNTENGSQKISLHYDTEKNNSDRAQLDQLDVSNELPHVSTNKCIEVVVKEASIENEIHDFSDDDMNIEDIDKLIENAEVLSQIQCDNLNSPMLIRDPQHLNAKPKLMGAPGMIIDLDGTDPFAIKKLTGVELLKERFAYFAKLKTPEEMERERERRLKPGLQHSKLKHELEEKMAEQRSLEWTKRLQEEKEQHMEMNAVRGDASDAEEDIEKIEAKLEESEDVQKESSSESEEEEEAEELSELKDKPRKRNPMIADEAEESDCDEFEDQEDREPKGENENIRVDENDGHVDHCEESEDESSEEESEEESGDEQAKPKKGRILKAFEDSDDEDTELINQEPTLNSDNTNCNTDKPSNLVENHNQNLVVKSTQDDELQLAQMHKSLSDDLFTSQESDPKVSTISTIKNVDTLEDDKSLGTQTFSILNPENTKNNIPMHFTCPDNLSINHDTQLYDGGSLDHVVGMCSGSFSQNLVTSQCPTTQDSQCEDIGEDVLALCTGKFYDNQFVSQLDDDDYKASNKISQPATKDLHNDNNIVDKLLEQKVDSASSDGNNKIDENDALDDKNEQNTEEVVKNDDMNSKTAQQTLTDVSQSSANIDTKIQKNYEKNLLTSIIDELNDPEFEAPKPNKYFVSNDKQNKENKLNIANGIMKKKFIIDSDDEGNDAIAGAEGKKKKFKKKKLEERALHISDDEEDEECDQDEEDDELSEIEEHTERMVEYDSEENEVIQEIQPEIRKKKRKVADFFEQEAELTSEDEWAGSGDEDEAGLDRMEREAGDEDTFHQGQLQRELGQIHMRDVLDQDKREVRIIQELLFEDGDLGAGSRQRKFRWRNEGGTEETDAAQSEFADTQEEEFESEEQWRKQRHEREMFLKQMQKQDETEDALNTAVNRTKIIKANLSRTMSSLLIEVNASASEKTERPAPEKKTTKDVPSPKKTFTMFQQTCHNSLLSRGRGVLARLAALATPLADDAAPKSSAAPSANRNFVFATLTQEEKPKVTKRKADSNAGTPKLVKKMKSEEKQNYPRGSLLDHIKT